MGLALNSNVGGSPEIAGGSDVVDGRPVVRHSDRYVLDNGRIARVPTVAVG
jgi:hypothetical protein